MEIKVYCKDAVKFMIHEVEERDPETVSTSVMNWMLDKIEYRIKKCIASKRKGARKKEHCRFSRSRKLGEKINHNVLSVA
jgi:hypothetical protein